MVTKRKQVKKLRSQYSAEYRAEASEFSDRVGVSAAAEQQCVHSSQINGWRGKEGRQKA